MEEALHSPYGLVTPALLPSPIVEGPPGIVYGLTVEGRTQLTGQVMKSCRQSQDRLFLLRKIHRIIATKDIRHIAFITELMNP